MTFGNTLILTPETTLFVDILNRIADIGKSRAVEKTHPSKEKVPRGVVHKHTHQFEVEKRQEEVSEEFWQWGMREK